MRMCEWLDQLESAIRDAEAGKSIVVHMWITDMVHDRRSAHALLRVLFLLMTLNHVSAEDVAMLRRQLKDATRERRRPVRQPRRPGERLSPRLF